MILRKTGFNYLCLMLCVFLFTGSVPKSEQVKTILLYDLMVNQTKSGSVRGEMIKNGNTVSFNLHSEFEVSLFQNYKVNTRFYSKYVGDVLQEGSMRKIVNGKLDDESSISLNGGNYGQSGPNKPDKLTGKIHFCVSRLYFNKPGMYKNIYSHSFGQMVQIGKKDDSTFELMLPDGKKNIYHFNNKGICDRVVIGGLLVRTELVLKEMRLE